MNLSENIVLKENYCFWVSDTSGNIQGGERGVYLSDTRFYSQYSLALLNDEHQQLQTLLAHSPRPDQAGFHYSSIQGPSELIGVQRTLTLGRSNLIDSLDLGCSGSGPQTLEVNLTLSADFLDLFEARGFNQLTRTINPPKIQPRTVEFFYEDSLGNRSSTRLIIEGPEPQKISSPHPGTVILHWVLELQPHESVGLRFVSTFQPVASWVSDEMLDYSQWQGSFSPSLWQNAKESDTRVLQKAVEDLRALLNFTPQGIVPSAGIPWFVAVFGRDSLLTAYMLLPHQPEVALGVLRYLGHHQASTFDTFRAAEPGKIMHEIRFGELTRLGLVPHSPYYGTVDATPLYIILLHKLWIVTKNDNFIHEFLPNWEAALEWMIEYGDQDKDGFLEYLPGEVGKGLIVQSWKDSNDSMMHNDGTLAIGAIRPAEVQGYLYRAYRAVIDFYIYLGDSKKAEIINAKAKKLKKAFDDYFWIDDLRSYAMALDGNHQPLKVLSSNAGQLFWTDILLEERKEPLKNTLMSPALWSGWGIRTLGAQEVRYNPLSYHNGSVWPHDTAIIALGLYETGFVQEAKKLARAIFDLAAHQFDDRLPELIGGYPRSIHPPIPYPVACRPQAWDAAALVCLQPLLELQV